jgi:hypothetical protein
MRVHELHVQLDSGNHQTLARISRVGPEERHVDTREQPIEPGRQYTVRALPGEAGLQTLLVVCDQPCTVERAGIGFALPAGEPLLWTDRSVFPFPFANPDAPLADLVVTNDGDKPAILQLRALLK